MPLLMRECPRCGEEKPDAEFKIYSRGRRINCMACDAEVYGEVQEEAIEPAFLPYSDYIVSKEWQQRRNLKVDAVGGKCEECGSTHLLHVHHLTYKNLGAEPDEDLQVLCERCHRSKHPDWK